MPDIRTTLPDLVARLLEDGQLDDADLALIHDATIAATNARLEAKRWAELAHVHDAPHRPVTTLVDVQRGDEIQSIEQVDASGVVCHDCGRDLVADVTEQRVLVCPTLHGRRDRAMVPTDPDGAVECGRRG